MAHALLFSVSRIARIVLEGIPYHITQRGNGRQRVFLDAGDYGLYLDLLRLQAEQSGLSIWAYCLMPNHVHLIGVPLKPGALAASVGRLHAAYAQHFNLRNRASGHVWQARYFSCPIAGAHLWRALAYVERNPLRAALVDYAENYKWSSAPARLGLAVDRVGLDLSTWRQEYTSERWRGVLRSSVDEEHFGQRLQEAARRGRPLGDEKFVEELERRTGRRLRPFAPGRPRNPGTVHSNTVSSFLPWAD